MGRTRAILQGATVLLLYLAMEWLYIVTKPSFTGMIGPVARVELLATSYLLVAVPFVFLLFLVSLVSIRGVMLVASLVLACLLFLLLDDFLYTVLRLGTLGSPSRYRIVYTAVFVGMLWLSYRLVQRPGWQRRGILFGTVAVLAVFAVLGTVAQVGAAPVRTVEDRASESGTAGVQGSRPNVVFLGIDGVEADLLSVYGSACDTTPFLKSTEDRWMIFENAFPDTSKTTGTTTALLTGRSPLDSHVGYPPQVLLGSNSFLHLPALLNRRGYHGYQRAIRYYADAIDLNMRDSFSEADGREPPFRWLEDTPWIRRFDDQLFFLQVLSDRISSRLRYIFFLADLVNEYRMAERNQGLGFDYDLEGVSGLERFVAEHPGPFYAHLHFLSTQCCRQRPRASVFTAGDLPALRPDEARRAAARLNAIRDSDDLIQEVYRFLQSKGLLEHTILVVYSDHSYGWDTVRRVPLLVRFPGGAHSGRRSDNVLLSMVPGLLTDYLGIATPDWMRPGPGLEAPSSPEPPVPGPPLFSLSSFVSSGTGRGRSPLPRITSPGPPNYGIDRISMILCSRWYKASLAKRKLSGGTVVGHTAPCPADSFPDRAGVIALFQRFAQEHGLVWGR